MIDDCAVRELIASIDKRLVDRDVCVRLRSCKERLVGQQFLTFLGESFLVLVFDEQSDFAALIVDRLESLNLFYKTHEVCPYRWRGVTSLRLFE